MKSQISAKGDPVDALKALIPMYQKPTVLSDLGSERSPIND
jgi:hypothetical protein